MLILRDQIILLGTGTCRSSSSRHSPGSLIILEGIPFLIDCGPGSQRQLAKIQENLIINLNHLFLTHLHVDHVSDLAIILKELYLLQLFEPFFIFGPLGTEKFIMALFTQVYSYLDPVLKFTRVQECEHGNILQERDISVSVIPTVHGIRSIAFRFDSPNHSSIGLMSSM